MSSRLWSSSMLYGCRRLSSVRHCWIVSFRMSHWHIYYVFMAFAPHLSFPMVVLSLVMVWIAHPRVGWFMCIIGMCVLWWLWMVCMGCRW
jgi:hypothetical protein